MAYYHNEGTYLCYYEQQPPGLSLDNPGGSFGIEQLLADHMSLAVEPSSSESSDRSTGYLEDAVVEWGERCKRRRTLQFQGEQSLASPFEIESVESILQELWSWNGCHEDLIGDISSLGDPFKNNQGARFGCSFSTYNGASPTLETISAAEPDPISSSTTSSFTKDDDPTAAHADAAATDTTIQHEKPTSHSATTQSPNDFSSFLLRAAHDNQKKRRRKKVVTGGILSPFTVIKPAGVVDGSLTLDDINEQLLRRPTRPVRHPVGEFACLPCVKTVAGPGLSGKAVVGLTRIHTQGRGTITIIRTKG